VVKCPVTVLTKVGYRFLRPAEEIIATVVGAELAAVILLTRKFDFSGKRLALLDLLSPNNSARALWFHTL